MELLTHMLFEKLPHMTVIRSKEYKTGAKRQLSMSKSQPNQNYNSCQSHNKLL